MTDSTNLMRLMQDIRPTEIYNLTAQSHVGVSLRARNIPPMSTRSLRLLEAVRIVGMEEGDAVLPGVDFGIVRSGPGSPQGAYTVLSALAYAVVKLYGYLSPKLPTIGLFPCIS
jgi:GDPmannose 4,6-dehydratase